MAVNDLKTDAHRLSARAPGRLNALDWIALILVIVGGLNWGSIALTGIDLVAALFGQMTLVTRVVYGLVGLAAIWTIFVAVRLGGDRS